MAILNFSLSPEALGQLHDVLICLGKFSEAVAIQANNDKLVLSALNSSNSAYASFTLTSSKFFSKYTFKPSTASGTQTRERFSCKIYNKALLSVFKGRVVDSTRERDTGVERCDVSVEDGNGRSGRNRFIIKIFCKHGVQKTYRLTFESVSPMHAVFARDGASNIWSISSKTLREFVEHFGPGTEQLDIYSENGRVSFTSYTEKIVLKQPLHTTIAIDAMEFTEFNVEDRLHIVISVKDFKSIVTHAGINNTNVKARYSRPSSPMQLTYGDDSILSEFILMTIGEARSGPTAQISSRGASNQPISRQMSAVPRASGRGSSSAMPPPSRAPPPSYTREDSRAKLSRPSPPPPQPSLQSKELFLPETDEDRRWDPVNYDEEEDEATLLWDVNTVTVGITEFCDIEGY
ncbi:DNA repair protein-like protein rad9 [Xylogone sp. PMI_703]|nr:DNA repair protein-like protein rad9 [Xylogone sp. PMI_703]